MTVEECATRILRLCCHPTPVATVAITRELRAILYTESVRAAGILFEASREAYRRSAFGVATTLRSHADEILATSPGREKG